MSYNINDEDEFNDLIIKDCNIEESKACNIIFREVLFRNVVFTDIEWEHAEFIYVTFENCDLSNINMDQSILHYSEFKNCRLMGTHLMEASMRDVKFIGCQCDYLILGGSNMKDVIFDECHMDQAGLSVCRMSNVQFQNCEMQRIEFSGTKLKGIDLSTCIIDGINVRLEDVKGLSLSPIQAIEFSKMLGIKVIDDIKNKNPYILFVAMGCPKQEEFIIKYMDSLPCKVFMGVGGSFDVIAEKVNRAPKWMINLGLEWLYRVLKEPCRIKRLGSIPKFLFRVVKINIRRV